MSSKISTMFKSKAVEFTSQLQAKFPALMYLPSAALKGMDGAEMISTYSETVSTPYHDHIIEKDESFFLNVPDAEIISASKGGCDTSMLTMLRGLWGDFGIEDKEVVWNFLVMFEKLVDAWKRACAKE